MKKTVLIIVIIIFINLSYAQTKQYKWTIKKSDNTTLEIWIQDILEISNTTYDFTCGTSTVSYGGRIYNTVLIGSQCWLKQNLNIGTILNSTTAADSMKNNGVIEKYCHSNDTNKCNTYGGFYQWNEAMQYVTTAGAKGICPTGWHIPTNAELTTLNNSVGGNSNALKAFGQGSGAGSGTDASGFSALLSGYRNNTGAFGGLTSNALFWSSSELNTNNAYDMFLFINDSNIYMNNSPKEFGFNVRCVKD